MLGYLVDTWPVDVDKVMLMEIMWIQDLDLDDLDGEIELVCPHHHMVTLYSVGDFYNIPFSLGLYTKRHVEAGCNLQVRISLGNSPEPGVVIN